MKKHGRWLCYGVFILVLLMVNPPILGIVNDYSRTNPLTFGWSTIILWLDFWYLIGITDFIIGMLTINSWKKDYNDIVISSEDDKDRERSEQQ